MAAQRQKVVRCFPPCKNRLRFHRRSCVFFSDSFSNPDKRTKRKEKPRNGHDSINLQPRPREQMMRIDCRTFCSEWTRLRELHHAEPQTTNRPRVRGTRLNHGNEELNSSRTGELSNKNPASVPELEAKFRKLDSKSPAALRRSAPRKQCRFVRRRLPASDLNPNPIGRVASVPSDLSPDRRPPLDKTAPQKNLVAAG